MYMYII